MGAPGKTRSGGTPPEHTRFQKGQSGNPGGRPRKNRDLKKLVEAELDQVISLTENGRRVRLTKREVIVKKLVNDAALGDPKAVQALIRLIGVASEPDNPVVAVDPAELARFTLRYLPKVVAGPGKDRDDDMNGEPDDDEDEEVGNGAPDDQTAGQEDPQ